MRTFLIHPWLLALIAVWVAPIHSGSLPNTVMEFDLGDFDPALSAGLRAKQIEDGWIALFDGQSFYGWKAESVANWRIADGQIEVDDGSIGLLRTTSQFDDFELLVEFKAAAATNSGIFFRTSPVPQNPADDCIELNIAPDDNPFPTGSLVGRKKSTPQAAPDTWHHFRIIAAGKQIQAWLDDKPTIDYSLKTGDVGKGYIGLQFNSGHVAFRNIYLRPLETQRLFNGKNLDGWNTELAEESKIRVTDADELHISGGRGQIETDERFGDFVLQLHCKTNAAGLNSGVFFRCIPGEMMNGYESQIQNQFNDSDPTHPVDCGTGGIFRRQNARRVNAADKKWFAKTIVAVGPHVSVWVNGYQVTDWTDTRRPDKNPRQGRRLEPGTIIFQGHDPTTDILLRNIQAKEIGDRRIK